MVVRCIGPILTVRSSGRPIFVINTVEAATELLEKRQNFACRPRWPMAELLGRQDNIGFQYYGDRLKRSRKALYASLNHSVVGKEWGQLLDAYSLRMIRRFLASPGNFYNDVQE